MRAFLDTNFLLDCVLPGRPEHGAAQTTKGLVDVGLIEGVVSACSLKDAYYILTKQAGEARAREVVRDCLKSYSVEPLDHQDLLACRVHPCVSDSGGVKPPYRGLSSTWRFSCS